MKKLLTLSVLTILICSPIFADDEPTFPGLVSSEVFGLGNGMVMHVERRNSCNPRWNA